MRRELRADFSQTFLLPPSFEDWVGPEHPARFIRAFVESLDFSMLGIDWNDAPTGRPTYSADLLLMVWLYGYFMHLRSTRKLEAGCREHMGLVWLSGMHTPDHNTLWRFFLRNKAALRRLFTQSVRVAAGAEMVGMVLHALDGTKIGAKGATRARLDRAGLKRLLDGLDDAVSDWEREIEETAAPDEPGTGIPEHLQGGSRLREQIKDAIEELESGEVDKVHPSDPDARVMKCSDINAKRLAYNSQAVVDAASGLIVAQGVSNESNDMHQLTPMLDEVEAMLGGCAQTTLADSGYATGAGLDEAERAQRDVLMNLPSRIQGDPNNPYHASHFDYDPDTDTVTCPRGETLEYKHTRKHRGINQELRLYRCMNKACPVRGECTKDRKGRGIELGPYRGAIARQKHRHRDEAERKLLRKRSGIVEGVFGTIKNTYGFKRYTRHRLENVRTEWALICTTYNLKKLYERWLLHHPGGGHTKKPAMTLVTV